MKSREVLGAPAVTLLLVALVFTLRRNFLRERSEIEAELAVLREQAYVGDSPATVSVVAKQFAWLFHYPGQDGRLGSYHPLGLDEADADAADDKLASVLVLPCGLDALVSLTSQDVIHCLGDWILAPSRDAIPGTETHARVTAPTNARSGELRCVQLCGSGFSDHHAAYQFRPEAEYADGLAAQPFALNATPK